MYYIGTSTKYIATKPDGYMYVTEDLGKARRYSTAQRAGQALVGLPKRFYSISSQWMVRQDIAEVEEDIIEVNTVSDTPNPIDVLTTQNDKTIEDVTEPDDIDYLTLFSEMSELKARKSGCLSKLQGKLSEINEEITDIEHLIEFSKYNAPNAYAAYKMLRDALQERRKIKDSIIAVKSLYENCNVNKIADDHGQLENRVYKPRRLTKLFDEVSDK